MRGFRSRVPIRWYVVLLLVGASLVLTGPVWAQKSDRGASKYDLIYACPDANPRHPIHVTFHFHIRFQPPTVDERMACKSTITPSTINWDCSKIGFPVTGVIDRVTGKWKELVAGKFGKFGVCHKVDI